MKYIIDVGHPAHVHYFRNVVHVLTCKGHEALFTAREKEITVDLLRSYQLPFLVIGKPGKGYVQKAITLIRDTFKLLVICLQYKPDMILNASPCAAFVAWLLGKPHIALEDTFNMEQIRLYLPFTSVVLTGDYPHKSIGKKEIKFPGYQELLYLHPNHYAPNSNVLSGLRLLPDEKYAIIRFVAWKATHDKGHVGMSFENKLALVSVLERYLRVFISSESDLPIELAQYKISIRPEQMHDVLYHAHLFVGEGATMASEAAILGTPAVFVHNTKLGYISDQATYGLLHHYMETEQGQKAAIDKAVEIAQDKGAKVKMAGKREKMLKDKIDVSAFLQWFIEDYPDSVVVMRKDPDYVLRFK